MLFYNIVKWRAHLQELKNVYEKQSKINLLQQCFQEEHTDFVQSSTREEWREGSKPNEIFSKEIKAYLATGRGRFNEAVAAEING
jgi:hypothetical protein